jgi:ribosomal-protein-serine acetyltransferase
MAERVNPGLLFPMDNDVSLRPFEDSDAAEFARAIQESGDTVGVWLPWFRPSFSVDDALLLIERFRQDAAGLGINFGVFATGSGELLGGTGLNQINRMHNFCNLCYWTRQSAQGRGIAVRAVRWTARHAFAREGFSRIEIVVAEGNDASRAVALKAGAVYEGIARNRLRLNGQPVAARVFSLVPEDMADA